VPDLILDGLVSQHLVAQQPLTGLHPLKTQADKGVNLRLPSPATAPMAPPPVEGQECKSDGRQEGQ
jgi:hypothetical protein